MWDRGTGREVTEVGVGLPRIYDLVSLGILGLLFYR